MTTSFSALEHDLDGEQGAPGGSSPLRLDVLGPQGETLRSLDLTEPALTVGQASGNQLVLDAEGVSRYHMRLSRDGARVMVSDLGGRSGTMLNEQRLVPHVETPMAPGGFLRVGPFRLRLSDPAAARTATTSVVAPGAVHSAVVLSIAGGRETLELTPGQPAVVVAVLTNNSDAPDSVTLSVEGIPAEWLRLPEGAVAVSPGSPVSLPLQVLAPRESASHAREYPVTLRARPQSNPAEMSAVSARWTVLPFAGSELELRPRKRIVRGLGMATYVLAIANSGNQPDSFTLRVGDDEPSLDYQIDQGRVTLEPGATATVRLGVQARENPTGRAQNYNFSVRAQSGVGTPLLATAQLTQQRPFPIWLVPVILLGFLALIASAAGLAWWLGRGSDVALASQAGITQVAVDGAAAPTLGAEMSLEQALQGSQTAIAQVNQVGLQQTALANAIAAGQSQSEPTIQALVAALQAAQAGQTAEAAQVAAAQAAAAQAAAAPQLSPAQQAAAAIQAALQAAGLGGGVAGQQAPPTYTPYPTYTPAPTIPPTSTSGTVTPTGNPATTPTNQPLPAASQLKFTVSPDTTVAGSVLSPAPEVQVQSSNGQMITSYTGVVSIRIENDGCSSDSNAIRKANLSGTFIVRFVAGKATFPDLLIDCAGINYKLQASVDNFTVSSDSFQIDPGPATMVKFITSPKDVPAGSTLSAVQLRVYDSNNNWVRTFTDQILLAITLGTGNKNARLNNSTSVTLNTVQGEATATNLTIDRIGREYTLTASSGSATGTSSKFNISAKKLVFIAPPTDTPAGSATLRTTVYATDDYGTPDTGFSSPISLTLVISPTNGATLSPLASLTQDAAVGSAVFTGLSINKVGTYQLRASAGTLVATSDAFNITANQLVFTQIPSVFPAGTPMTFTVEARDAAGVKDANFSARCTITMLQGNADTPVPSNVLNKTPADRTPAAGVIQMVEIEDVYSQVPGQYRFKVTCGSTLSVTSPPFSVISAVPDHVTVSFDSTQPSRTFKSTDVFTVTATVQDRFDNEVSGYTGTVGLQLISNSSASVTILNGQPIPRNVEFGHFTFSIQVKTANTSQTPSYTLRPVLISPSLDLLQLSKTYKKESDSFVITAGAADHLAFSTQPIASYDAGSQFTVVVEAQDVYGNHVPNFTDGVTLAIATGTGTPSAVLTRAGGLTVTADGNYATFNGLWINKATDRDNLPQDPYYALQATNTTATLTEKSNDFSINYAAPYQIIFSNQPPPLATVDAGESIFIDLEAVDLYGNIVKSFSETPDLIFDVNPTGATLQRDGRWPDFVGGKVALAVNITKATPLTGSLANQPYTLKALSTGAQALQSSPSNSLKINALDADHLVFTTQPVGPYVANKSFSVTVQVQDVYNNPATTTPTSVLLSITQGRGAQGASLQGAPATPVLTDANGEVTFSGLSIIKVHNSQAELSYELHAASGTLFSDSNPFNIIGDNVNYLTFKQQPSSGRSGFAWSVPALQVQAWDQYGNPATPLPNEQIRLTPFSGTGVAPGLNIVSGSDVAVIDPTTGVATFGGLTMTGATASPATYPNLYELNANIFNSTNTVSAITSESFNVYNSNSELRFSYEYPTYYCQSNPAHCFSDFGIQVYDGPPAIPGVFIGDFKGYVKVTMQVLNGATYIPETSNWEPANTNISFDGSSYVVPFYSYQYNYAYADAYFWNFQASGTTHRICMETGGMPQICSTPFTIP